MILPYTRIAEDVPLLFTAIADDMLVLFTSIADALFIYEHLQLLQPLKSFEKKSETIQLFHITSSTYDDVRSTLASPSPLTV